MDLGRIFMLMQLDILELMGYTGAFFQQFFNSSVGGMLIVFISLSLASDACVVVGLDYWEEGFLKTLETTKLILRSVNLQLINRMDLD